MERQPSTFIGKKKASTIQMATMKTKFWSEARMEKNGLSKMALKCCFILFYHIYIYNI